MSEPEQKLWYYLRKKNLSGYKFRRQYSIGNYVLDFYCPKAKLAIEIDGDSHYFDATVKKYDRNRTNFLKSKNIKVVRFANTDVANNLDAVLEKIVSYLT